MADDSSDLLEGLHSLDITACKEHIRQLQARRERRRELVERLQEKLKALNNELAARKEEADRCKKDLLEEQAKNRRLAEARRGQKAGKEVATIQDDQQREQEMDLQTANVRRFMESTLQEKVKRDSTQNELGIRIYDEVELMVEKSADEQAQESKYIDTVLVTYCIPNSELKYNLSFRVDRNMKTKKLREDACLYWGLSEVEFILKTMSNAKVHDELAIQSCFRENEDAHFSLVQKTPKNATLMDRELLHIMPKAGRKARRVAKQSAKRDEAKGDAATRTGVGDLAEQMLLLPGLFRYMTQRDKNVKQHLQRLKLQNICIYLAVLVMTIVDIYMRIPPALAFNCRQGVLELMTEGDGQGLSFDDIRSSDQVWLWLSDTVADQLLVPSSPLRTYNYPVGYLQVRLQEVQIPTQAQCPQLDLAYSVPENVTCFATRYTASKANTIEDDGVRHYFYGKSGYAGRYVNSAPWSFGNERSTSPAGEPWILGHFDEFDGSGQSIEYDLQYSPLDELRQAFLNDMLFLQGQNWLDPQSRALHVSFLLYNSNYDHFISNRYTVEMTAFGVVRPFSEIGVFRPGFVEYDLGFSMLSLDIIRLCFVLLICPVQIYWDFMYERRVNGAGCKHLYSVQGLADLAVGIIFFVMFGLRYGNFNVPSIDYFVQQAQTPLDAGEFAEQYNFHIVMDALISGLLLYRFAFFLRINRHFFLIWSTVEQAAMVGCRRSLSKTRATGDEPKQLAQWAEHLHQELLDLTQERDGLLGQLADAQTATKKMQMELESLRRRSAQFERVICGDQVPMDVIGENGDLRSQLKAYEAEVEELRAERGRLQTCHTRSQQIVQQLHKEREELRAQHRQILDEHEHSKANCSRLQSLHGSERLQRQRLESQLHSQSGEKEIAAATRHEGLQKEHLKAWEELQRVHGLAKDKDAKLELAMKLAQEAIGMATELQDAFVQQTKKYHELSRSVRKHQGQLLQDMKEAQELPRLAEDFALELQQLLGSAREANSIGEEQWKKEARKLEDQVQNLTMQHREVAKTVREFRQADDDRKAKDLEQLSKEDDRRKLKMQRDGRLSNPNIIKQMAQATDGLEISKVDERNRMEKRPQT